jgi:hypothetical protein
MIIKQCSIEKIMLLPGWNKLSFWDKDDLIVFQLLKN